MPQNLRRLLLALFAVALFGVATIADSATSQTVSAHSRVNQHVAGVQVVDAESPHFISASAALSGTQLVLSWKEAGLGNATVDYSSTLSASAVYACLDGGNGVTSDYSTGGQTWLGGFFLAKNGAVSGSLTVPPPPPTGFSCVSGESLVLARVTYSGVTVQDSTNAIPAPTGAGPYCASQLAAYPC